MPPPTCHILGLILMLEGGAETGGGHRPPDVPRPAARNWTWTALPASRSTLFDGREARAPDLAPPGPANELSRELSRELSKKAQWLLEKERRADVHIDDESLGREATAFRKLQAKEDRARRAVEKPVLQRRTDTAPAAPTMPTATAPLPAIGMRFEPVVTLFNLRTREAVPILPGPRIPGPTQEKTFCNLLRDHFTNQATDMDLELLLALTQAATHFGSRRIEIVSGYRSPKYNLTLRKKGREVAAASKHTVGQAVDFRVRGVSTEDLLQFVRSLKLGGVGYYPHSQFVHCDTGPVRYWRGS